MFRLLLFLFIAIPILEIYILIQVGEKIGLLSTLLTIICTALVGASLVRHEGIKTLYNLQEKLNRQEMPGQELADGALLLLAGVLLVTPGFFTDGVGFFLAFPWSRALLRNGIVGLIGQNVHGGRFTHHGHPNTGDNQTIDGEFHRHSDDPPPEKAPDPSKPLE
ncbi:MAG: FxsA family protein [Magnetococcales bacterium]|nr:FxsA family protein [Magnetococcales bacterium]